MTNQQRESLYRKTWRINLWDIIVCNIMSVRADSIVVALNSKEENMGVSVTDGCEKIKGSIFMPLFCFCPKPAESLHQKAVSHAN